MAETINPNALVNDIVEEYRLVLSNELLSVFLFGSVVTHEFDPRTSPVKTGIVVAGRIPTTHTQLIALQTKWKKVLRSLPRIYPVHLLSVLTDTNPLGVLSMQSNYRNVFGEDYVSTLSIDRNRLTSHCLHVLAEQLEHLQGVLFDSQLKTRDVLAVFNNSIEQLIPVFKAVLILHEKNQPNSTSDIIGVVEEFFHIESQVFTRIHSELDSRSVKKNRAEFSMNLYHALTALIGVLSSMETI